MTATARGVEGAFPSAVLFDMDGLLVDSEPVWTIGEIELAERLGGTFTPAVKAAMIGHGIVTAMPIMLDMLGVPDADPVAAGEWLLDRTTALFREPGRLVMLPGAVELLDVLGRLGTPTALVSSSYRVLVDAVLDVVGHDRFTVTVAGDEVARAKPHPDPYLAAAVALGLEPAACVVLEDSVAGATAGLAAGCRTVLVPSYPPSSPLDGATVVTSLREVTPAFLRTLMT